MPMCDQSSTAFLERRIGLTRRRIHARSTRALIRHGHEHRSINS
jgi:hypothetical protein